MENRNLQPCAYPNACTRRGFPSTENDRCCFHSDGCERLAKPPEVQEPRRIGRDLEACAYIPENGGRLEECDAVSGVCECVGPGETANACADDDDVETERGAVAAIEWRDFL